MSKICFYVNFYVRKDSFGWKVEYFMQFHFDELNVSHTEDWNKCLAIISAINCAYKLCCHLNPEKISSHYNSTLLKIIVNLFCNKVGCSSSEFQSQQLYYVSTFQPRAG